MKHTLNSSCSSLILSLCFSTAGALLALARHELRGRTVFNQGTMLSSQSRVYTLQNDHNFLAQSKLNGQPQVHMCAVSMPKQLQPDIKQHWFCFNMVSTSNVRVTGLVLLLPCCSCLQGVVHKPKTRGVTPRLALPLPRYCF